MTDAHRINLPKVYQRHHYTPEEQAAVAAEDKEVAELTDIGRTGPALSAADKSLITHYSTDTAVQKSEVHDILSNTRDKGIWSRATELLGSGGDFGFTTVNGNLAASLTQNLRIGEFVSHNLDKLHIKELHRDLMNAGKYAGFGNIAASQGIGYISPTAVYGENTLKGQEATAIEEVLADDEQADVQNMKADSKVIKNAQGKYVLAPFKAGAKYMNMLPQLVDANDDLATKVYLAEMGEADLKAYQGYESVDNALLAQYNPTTNQTAFEEQSKGLQGLSDRSWTQGVKASRADQVWGELLGVASYYSGLPGGQLTGSKFMQAAGFGGEIPPTATAATSQGGTGQASAVAYSANIEYRNMASEIATGQISATHVENDAAYATAAASGWGNTITALGLGKKQGGKFVDTTEKKYQDDPTAQALAGIEDSGPIQYTTAGSYYQLGLADKALRAGVANVVSAFKVADDEYDLWKGMSTVDTQYADVLEAKPSLLPKALNDEQASMTAANKMLSNKGIDKWLQVARPSAYLGKEAAEMKGAASIWKQETAMVQAQDVKDAMKTAKTARQKINKAWADATASDAGTIGGSVASVAGGLVGVLINLFTSHPAKKVHKSYKTAEHVQNRIEATMRTLIEGDPSALLPLFAKSKYWRKKHLLHGLQFASGDVNGILIGILESDDNFIGKAAAINSIPNLSANERSAALNIALYGRARYNGGLPPEVEKALGLS